MTGTGCLPLLAVVKPHRTVSLQSSGTEHCTQYNPDSLSHGFLHVYWYIIKTLELQVARFL